MKGKRELRQKNEEGNQQRKKKIVDIMIRYVNVWEREWLFMNCRRPCYTPILCIYIRWINGWRGVSEKNLFLERNMCLKKEEENSRRKEEKNKIWVVQSPEEKINGVSPGFFFFFSWVLLFQLFFSQFFLPQLPCWSLLKWSIFLPFFS